MSLHGAPSAPGVTHLLAAQASPWVQPSVTVHAPPEAERGAHTPQSLVVFSQCALMHCQLEPQPSPFKRLPGLIWHEGGGLLLTRSSHVAFAASRAQAIMSAVVAVMSELACRGCSRAPRGSCTWPRRH